MSTLQYSSFYLSVKKGLSYLAVTGSLLRPIGGGGGLFFKYFSSSKSTVRQFFSSLLSSQSFQHENSCCLFMRKTRQVEEEGIDKRGWSLTSMLSHLFSILIHFPSWHVKWVDGQALSCSWTLIIGACFTVSEDNVI